MDWMKIKSWLKFRSENERNNTDQEQSFSKPKKEWGEMDKKKLSIKEIGIERLVIMLLCGVFIIILSVPDIFSFLKGPDKTPQKSSVQTADHMESITDDSNTEYEAKLEAKLKKVLEKVDGIGKTEVMITLKSSKESVILKNNPYTQQSTSENDSQGGSRVSSSISKEDETVLVDNKNGASIPYVIKEMEPKVEGVVVIAQGGGDINIINEINSAIEVLFDVPVHKIKVMKMNDIKQ